MLILFVGCARLFHSSLNQSIILSTHSILGRTERALKLILVFNNVNFFFRGKFIYISQEELEAVAKFIKQQGRVSISDLALNSNKLITL